MAEGGGSIGAVKTAGISFSLFIPRKVREEGMTAMCKMHRQEYTGAFIVGGKKNKQEQDMSEARPFKVFGL